MLFFGGVDDREALAYAGRMAGHPRTSLTVISFNIMKKSVTRWEQILSLISSMEGEYDMYIVGRRHGNISEVTMTLLDGIDSNDLGFLGDALVSSNFTASTSILVVQQGRLLDYYS
ncbi:hypothetical protein ACFX2J_028123 [Malus domestica]